MSEQGLVSGALRAAILNAGVSRYRIAQEAGVDEATLSRFVAGKRTLSLENVDKLARYFRLELRPVGKGR